MEHVALYVQYLEYEKRYSPHTVKSYRNTLGYFEQYISGNEPECTCIDFKSVRRWVVSLVAEGNSPRTINHKITVLRSYFRFLMKKGLVANNPMEKVGLLKTDKNLPAFVTADKLDELLDEDIDASDFSAMRDHVIMELFYMTGIRLTELIHLKDSDVDTGAMTVKVLGKRNKERIIPLMAGCCATLRKYLSLKKSIFPDSVLLFILDSGKPLYERWVQHLTSEKLSAVTTMKKRSPHVLRHSFATNMLDNGADLNAIREILGHASLAATQVYTHSSLKRIKKVYKQAHPRA